MSDSGVDGPQESPRLTGREREVLKHVLAGHSSKVIGRKLGISPRTVEVYRSRVMHKMQAKNLVDLVKRSLRAGLDKNDG